MRRSLLALLAALSLLAAACGDDADVVSAPGSTSTTDDGDTTTTSPTSTSTTGGGGGAGATAPFDGGTAPVEVPSPGGEGTALLTDVRVGAHEGFERVVFEFENRLPDVEVRYVDPPVLESGSGRVVQVAGGSLLAVAMHPASGVDLSGAQFRETYTGPERVTGATDVVEEVVRSGDFEALLEWVVGLRREVPFRVETASAPPRVIVDVATS